MPARSLQWALAASHHPHSALHCDLCLLGPCGRPGIQKSTWYRRSPPGLPVCSSSWLCVGLLAPRIRPRQQSARSRRHSRQAASLRRCAEPTLLPMCSADCLATFESSPCHAILEFTGAGTTSGGYPCLFCASLYGSECLADQQLLFCAVFLGTFTLLAVRFHSIEPWAGFLLLPFLGYTVFAAALLNLSLRSDNAEVSMIRLMTPVVTRQSDHVLGRKPQEKLMLHKGLHTS